MRNSLKVWQFVLSRLESGRPVCLLYVLHSAGSSPGRQGFCMAVDAAGDMEGSIGGGLMEQRMVELGKDSMVGEGVPPSTGPVHGGASKLAAGNPTGPLVRRQVHASTAGEHASGMICSGEQTVFIYPLVRSGALQTVKVLCAALAASESGDPETVIGRSNDGKTSLPGGVLRLSSAGISFESGADMETAFNYRGPKGTADSERVGVSADAQTDDAAGDDARLDAHPVAGPGPVVVAPAYSRDWLYEERIGHKDKLFIVGGGHCSLAFSQIARNLDFYVEVIDNRPGLNTLERNDFAHGRRVVESYSELAQILPEGRDVYVVVMTFGYKTDDVAVRAILNKDFKYFGLLGSRKKIETLFAAYAAEGLPVERLRRIHAPVGVPIKSRTPEEIAVSIAAEIIGVRNRFLP